MKQKIEDAVQAPERAWRVYASPLPPRHAPDTGSWSCLPPRQVSARGAEHTLGMLGGTPSMATKKWHVSA